MNGPISRRAAAALIVCVACLAPLAAARSLRACTAFQLKAVDGAQVYFRSMEFGFPFNSKILIVPRGTEYTGTAPQGRAGLKWQTKYGVVGLNANVAPSIVADGMNDKGLVVGMLYLPGYARYLAPDEAKTASTIGSWEVAIALGSSLSLSRMADPALASVVVMAIHRMNCTKPTMAMPMILPIISWNGRTLLMSTSTTRFCFSSITPRITCMPYMKMKMNMK